MGVAYFDCFSGVAGDMVLGALIDAGMSLAHFEKELKKLGLAGYKLSARKDTSSGIAGTNLHVQVLNEPAFRKYSDIRRLILGSRLKPGVKDLSLKIFGCLAVAESKVHGRKVSDVHFHEIGGLDSFIDIVGTAIGIDYFGFEKIYSSPLPMTRGYVKCSHGKLPIPAPATLEIIKGIPVENLPVRREVVTPTGAAIVKTLASGFGSSPLRKIEKVAYGFGDNKIPGMPNALRLFIGEGFPLMLVETNIDDMIPEVYPYVIDRIIKAGALDAGVMPVVMKRGRPGCLLFALCEEKDRRKIVKIIMDETTTFGVRYCPVDREIAERETKKVKTKWGVVRVKIARYDGRTTTVSPEYLDCEKIALKKKIPVKEVYRQAILNVRV